jgi:hypothetical protein
MDDTTVDEVFMDIESKCEIPKPLPPLAKIDHKAFFKSMFLCLCFLPTLFVIGVFLYFDLSFISSVRNAIDDAIDFVMERIVKELFTGNLIFWITG